MKILEVNKNGYAVEVELTDRESKAMEGFNSYLDIGYSIHDAAAAVIVSGPEIPDSRFERYMNDYPCFTQADVEAVP